MATSLSRNMIWKHKPDIDRLNSLLKNTLSEALGMRITVVGEDFLEGTMPVDSRTTQPFGLLHGGASAALAETLGSLGSHLILDADRQFAVGLDLSVTHLRAVRQGIVTGRARAVQIGATIHVWTIEIRDEGDRLVSTARLTALVRSHKR